MVLEHKFCVKKLKFLILCCSSKFNLIEETFSPFHVYLHQMKLNLHQMKLNLHQMKLNLHQMKLIMHQMKLIMHQMKLIMHQMKFNLHQMKLVYQMKLNLHQMKFNFHQIFYRLIGAMLIGNFFNDPFLKWNWNFGERGHLCPPWR